MALTFTSEYITADELGRCAPAIVLQIIALEARVERTKAAVGEHEAVRREDRDTAWGAKAHEVHRVCIQAYIDLIAKLKEARAEVMSN